MQSALHKNETQWTWYYILKIPSDKKLLKPSFHIFDILQNEKVKISWEETAQKGRLLQLGMWQFAARE